MKNKPIAGFAILLLLLMLVCVCFSGTADASTTDTVAEGEKEDLIIFAATSLQDTLTEIGDRFSAANPDINLIFSFDSTGSLALQILEGVDVDIFFSAAVKQMDSLDAAASAEANPDRNDYILEGTRTDMLENRVVLTVPEGNPAGIKSFDALADRLRAGKGTTAIGNNDVAGFLIFLQSQMLHLDRNT